VYQDQIRVFLCHIAQPLPMNSSRVTGVRFSEVNRITDSRIRILSIFFRNIRRSLPHRFVELVGQTVNRCPCGAGSFVVLIKLKERNMCPVCITTMALMVAGATSSGGLTLFAVKKIHPKNGANKIISEPSSKNNLL
jgi:hypothetical protein